MNGLSGIFRISFSEFRISRILFLLEQIPDLHKQLLLLQRAFFQTGLLGGQSLCRRFFLCRFLLSRLLVRLRLGFRLHRLLILGKILGLHNDPQNHKNAERRNQEINDRL